MEVESSVQQNARRQPERTERQKAEIRSWAGTQNARNSELGDDGLNQGKKSSSLRRSRFSLWSCAGCVGGANTASASGKAFCSPLRTLPKESEWARRKGGLISFLDASFRGIGQVFFQNSPITGFFCLIAILASNLMVGLLGFLGVASATLFAKIFGFDEGLIASGILGYNGALAGCALAVFQFGSNDNPVQNSQYNVLIGVVLTSTFSVVITSGLASVMVPKLRLTPLTFPFQLVTWMWLLSAQRSAHFPATYAPTPSLANQHDPDDLPVPERMQYDGFNVLESIFSGISQTFLVGDWYSGVIMLFGIALCSPIAASWAFAGSVMGTLSALIIGVPTSSVYAGLYGYNGALCGIAIGGFFLVLRGGRVYALAAFAALLSGWVNAAVGSVFQPMGMPPLTFPFTVIVWIALLAAASLPSTFTVGIESLTSPEDHMERLMLNDKLTSSFGFVGELISVESTTSPESVAQIEEMLLPLVLCSKAGQGEIEEIHSMIQLGADINKADYDGRTALHLAVAEGHAELVKFLIENRANVNAQDVWGGTPMEDLVRSNGLTTDQFQRILHVLQTNGGKLNLESISLAIGPRMCRLAYEGDVESIRRLLVSGVPAETADYDNRTAAHIAAAGAFPTRDLQTLELLMSYGKDEILSVKDRYGNTPIDDATRHKFYQAMNLLNVGCTASSVAEGISVHATSSEETSITIAGEGESIAARQPSNGAQVDSFGITNTQTPLLSTETTMANQQMFMDVAFQIAKDGHSFEHAKHQSNRIIPSLMCAFAANPSCSTAKLRTLLNCGFSARVQDYDLRTPLHIAVESDDQPAVEFLLNRGADPTVADRWEVTPLWTAICKGHNTLAVLLRSHGATIGFSECYVGTYLCQLASDPSNLTLLRCAILSGGCNPSAYDYDKRTPLHVAADLGHDSLVSLLLNLGAKRDVMDRWGKCPNVTK